MSRIIMDQLLEADKYNYLRKYLYIFKHFLMHTIFHNKGIIKKEKEKWCDRVVKNVLQFMVHSPSDMIYSL